MLPRLVVLAAASAALLAGCGEESSPNPATTSPTATATSASPTASPPPGPTATATASPTESASASEVACQPFGSTTPKESEDPLAMSPLTGASMRVGRHDCYERFVFELAGTGDAPGWSVQYRDPLIADPSGQTVDLRGDADLEVIVRVWTVTDFEGRPDEWPPFSGPDDIVTTGYTAIREARNLYAFEGVTQLGLGLDERRPFRVSLLEGPVRLVVDVYTGQPLD